jgi:hypothetical protein
VRERLVRQGQRLAHGELPSPGKLPLAGIPPPFLGDGQVAVVIGADRRRLRAGDCRALGLRRAEQTQTGRVITGADRGDAEQAGEAVQRRGEVIARRGERRLAAVADRLVEDAAVRRDRRAEDRQVALDRRPHRPLVPLRKGGAVFAVGEQEGDDAGGDDDVGNRLPPGSRARPARAAEGMVACGEEALAAGSTASIVRRADARRMA